MRVLVVGLLLLSACFEPMVRAPKQIPPSGVVTCTDSRETPVKLTLLGAAALSPALYGHYNREWAFDNIFVIILAGTAAVVYLTEAPFGFAYATECSEMKRIALERNRKQEQRAARRAEAGELWRTSATAARADDCATVRTHSVTVEQLDAEFHAVVFMRDVAILRCLQASP